MIEIKRSIIVLLACFLLLAGLAAAELDYTLEPKVDKIMANDTAYYDLTIINSRNDIKRYTIYSPNIEWGIETIPLRDRNEFKIFADESKTTTLTINPRDDIQPGLYRVNVEIQDLDTNEVTTVTTLVEVTSPRKPVGEYTPAIHVQASVPNKVDPRNPVDVNIELENRNPKDLSEIVLKLRSDLINKDIVTSLGPRATPDGQRALTATFKLDPLQGPATDTLRVTAEVKAGEKTYVFDAKPITFEVDPYGMIKKDAHFEKKFLKRKLAVTFTNEGNVPHETPYVLDYPLVQGLFRTVTPEGLLAKELGRRSMVYNIKLDVQESTTIIMDTNYWPLFLAGMAIVVLIILYYLFRSPVLVTKTTKILSRKDGGIQEMNVQVHIRSRASYPLNHLKIFDRIPNILVYRKEDKIGTLPPVKVYKHEKKGSVVKWEIDTLDKGDERIISYDVTAKLPILGHFILPRAVVKYRRWDKGKRYTPKSSNRVNF